MRASPLQLCLDVCGIPNQDILELLRDPPVTQHVGHKLAAQLSSTEELLLRLALLTQLPKGHLRQVAELLD